SSWAGSSYGANFNLFGAVRTGGNGDGPACGIYDIPDGSSNTVMFAEMFATSRDYFGNPTSPGTTGNGWCYPGIDWDRNWTPVFSNIRSYTATVMDMLPQYGVTVQQADKRVPQTVHSALVVVMGDVSTKMLGPRMTANTWHALQGVNDKWGIGS